MSRSFLRGSAGRYLTRGRRLIAVGLLASASLLATGGLAYAYLTETGHVSSSGGHGTVAPSNPTISAGTATLSGTLYPGGSANLLVTVTNSSNLSVSVQGITAGAGNVVVTGGSGCTTSNDGLSVNTGATFLPTTVSPNSASSPITFTNAVRMTASANSGCAGAIFLVPIAVTVKAG